MNYMKPPTTPAMQEVLKTKELIIHTDTIQNQLLPIHAKACILDVPTDAPRLGSETTLLSL